MCLQFWRETPSRYTSVFHQPASKTAQTTHPLVTWALGRTKGSSSHGESHSNSGHNSLGTFNDTGNGLSTKSTTPLFQYVNPARFLLNSVRMKFMLHLQLKNQPYQSYRKSNVNKWFENWKNLHSLQWMETSWSPCDRGLGNPFENENRNSQSISQTFKFVFPTANRRRHFPHILTHRQSSRKEETSFDIYIMRFKEMVHPLTSCGFRFFEQNRTRILISALTTTIGKWKLERVPMVSLTFAITRGDAIVCVCHFHLTSRRARPRFGRWLTAWCSHVANVYFWVLCQRQHRGSRDRTRESTDSGEWNHCHSISIFEKSAPGKSGNAFALELRSKMYNE